MSRFLRGRGWGRRLPTFSPSSARGGRERLRPSLCLGHSLNRKVSRSAAFHSAITAPQTWQLATVRSWTCEWRTSTEYRAPQLSHTKSLRPSISSQDFTIDNSRSTRASTDNLPSEEPAFSAWRLFASTLSFSGKDQIIPGKADHGRLFLLATDAVFGGECCPL